MKRLTLLYALVLCLLTACETVPPAGFAAMRPLPDTARPAPMSLAQIAWRLPTGSKIGSAGSGWCLVRSPIGRNDLRGAITPQDLKDTFHDTLQGEGYDVTGSRDLIFDEEVEADMLRSEYRIGAEIVDARTDLCMGRDHPLFATATNGFTGRMYLKIRWHVFDSLRRASAYRVETEGYARRRLPNPEGVSLLLDDAFAMAAHNLGADPAFQDLIVHGVRPAQADIVPSMPIRPRRFDPTAPLDLQARPLSRTPFAATADTGRRVAVMVQGGIGHGSGFFISGQGDILTNAHVVGDALHVRVTLSDRGQAFTAEVVRIDRGRDVALVRLMEPPAAHPVLLPLRLDWPKVGTRVYAVGAPLDPRLQDSVTSGIVSAWRRHFSLLGTRQDFIQSDVTIQPGNSGGPLLDENGNIVGFTVAGMSNDNVTVGLNYFIPIGEALKALDIALK